MVNGGDRNEPPTPDQMRSFYESLPEIYAPDDRWLAVTRCWIRAFIQSELAGVRSVPGIVLNLGSGGESYGIPARLQRRKYAGSSIRRKLASLRAFFSYLVESEQLLHSPMKDLRIRLGAMKRLTRVVPRHDLRAVVRKADQLANRYSVRLLSQTQRFMRLRNALIVRLLCVTGMRVGELVALQLIDVQQREKALIIQGKGNRERLAFVSDAQTVLLLARYVSVRQTLFPDHPSLITNARGFSLRTESVRQILRQLGQISEAGCKITPHMLRHTAATALLENGADLRIVQVFLGHDSIRSTERYTHVAKAHLLRVLRHTNPLKRVA